MTRRTQTALDDHGQPLNFSFGTRTRRERDIAELLGMAKGLIADGVVNQPEADALVRWGEEHPDAANVWPLDCLFERLRNYYADGVIDQDERVELLGILEKLTEGRASTRLVAGELASEFPLDDPPPLVSWAQEVFVFTGQFAWGPRKRLQEEVIVRGGACEDDVTRRTSFLVIGTFRSRDWRQTPYGRKIEHAATLRSSGFPLRIIGENHWVRALAGGDDELGFSRRVLTP